MPLVGNRGQASNNMTSLTVVDGLHNSQQMPSAKRHRRTTSLTPRPAQPVPWQPMLSAWPGRSPQGRQRPHSTSSRKPRCTCCPHRIATPRTRSAHAAAKTLQQHKNKSRHEGTSLGIAFWAEHWRTSLHNLKTCCYRCCGIARSVSNLRTQRDQLANELAWHELAERRSPGFVGGLSNAFRRPCRANRLHSPNGAPKNTTTNCG